MTSLSEYQPEIPPQTDLQDRWSGLRSASPTGARSRHGRPELGPFALAPAALCLRELSPGRPIQSMLFNPPISQVASGSATVTTRPISRQNTRMSTTKGLSWHTRPRRHKSVSVPARNICREVSREAKSHETKRLGCVKSMTELDRLARFLSARSPTTRSRRSRNA